MKKSMLQSGFTMIEVLIVTAILGILIIIAISMLPRQLDKARDGRRKSDLQKIKIAFENYYSDNECYPEPTILDECGGTGLNPYLANIPCDPKNETKYLYAPEGEDCPKYYRVFSNLEVDTDPVIEELGCDTVEGCGAHAFFELDPDVGSDAVNYDYGVSEGIKLYVSESSSTLTVGYCCQVMLDQCNVWNKGEPNCTVSGPYSLVSTCNTACGFSNE
jgi:prepilin-type N-terminal cleavage/methylation domain-containing protein